LATRQENVSPAATTDIELRGLRWRRLLILQRKQKTKCGREAKNVRDLPNISTITATMLKKTITNTAFTGKNLNNNPPKGGLSAPNVTSGHTIHVLMCGCRQR